MDIGTASQTLLTGVRLRLRLSLKRPRRKGYCLETFKGRQHLSLSHLADALH